LPVEAVRARVGAGLAAARRRVGPWPGILVTCGGALLALSGFFVAEGAQQMAARRVVTVAWNRPASPPPPAGVATPDVWVSPVRIERGATFGTLMQGYGLPADAIRRAAMAWHDLADVRPDRELALTWRDGESAPIGLRYALDEDRAVVVQREGEGWTAHLDQVAWTGHTGTIQFSIGRSLWEDGLEAGLRPADLARLAKIFEYDLDFNTELRDGAAFSLVGEKLTAPGQRPRMGDLHAVRLHNGDKAWTAIRHVDGEGREVWYQPDGTSLRKPFLRSPIEYSRVTSNFGTRRHPILGTTRHHNGTDLGAPTGTPVRAVAEAKVVHAGWNGGHGNFVKLEHEGGYATSYSHLSKVDVKKGQRVRQGTLIGKVGSTGFSTGPHLHWQMWKSGKFVDPMKVALPVQAPIPDSERAAFEEFKARVLPLLDQADPPVAPAWAQGFADPLAGGDLE
jgi:murein DD-endopeptidase MepM/ murein hydrolase activator NlpD